MTDFSAPARCSSSGQTCSTSDVVRPEVNKINSLTKVEDKHVCPLVRPLFVLKKKVIAMSYLNTKTNNGSLYIIYREADLSVPPPYAKIISARSSRLWSFPKPIGGAQ